MQIFKTTTNLKRFLDTCRDNNKIISLVPTMGGLHDGHLKLVDRAKEISDIVVVSIFVNPTQFARGEDFDDYPNTFSSDQKQLESKGVSALFFPSRDEIYPDGIQNDYKVGAIGQILCGAFRPTHFDGVAQAVKRFFKIVEPDYAIFGEKDFQQLAIIKSLVERLNLDINIESVGTQREKDGLAMSTRNQYLSSKDRKKAPNFYIQLNALKNSILGGSTVESARLNAIERLNEEFETEYLEVLDANNLTQIETKTKEIIIISAIRFGGTRLIDNIVFRRVNV
jgi:pantoate--beta-alanine ligase